MSEATKTVPEWLTREETIGYLGLDREGGDPAERLRTLCRRQRLPFVRRGRLLRFNRRAIDAWLEAGSRGGRTATPARLAVSAGKNGN
jgi:excisionase family DNA binding protein